MGRAMQVNETVDPERVYSGVENTLKMNAKQWAHSKWLCIYIVTVDIYKPFLLLVLYSFNPSLQPHKIMEPSSQLSRENWDPRSAVQYPEFVSHEEAA